MSALAFIDNYKAVRARIEAQGRAFMKAQGRALDERRRKKELQVDELAPVVIQYEPPYRSIYNRPIGPQKPEKGIKIYSLPIGPLIMEPGVVIQLYGKDCRRQEYFASLTLKALMLEVCTFFNVSKIDFLSSRRTVNLVLPRQTFMWRARYETKHSLPEIGRAVGGKDHTTVLHGVRKIDALLAAGKITRADLGAPAEAGVE